MGNKRFPSRQADSSARLGAREIPDPESRDPGSDQNDLLIDGDPALGEDLLRVAALIKSMPDLDPPEVLLPSIMNAVRPRRRPWWYRLYRWARAPRSISFTPLQALSGAATLATVCVAVNLYMTGGAPRDLYQARLEPALSQGRELVPVKLSLRMPEAGSVAVVGSFNGWHARECSMHKERETWTITLDLPAGRYEYGFMVDGKKIIPDPVASIYQDDGFGNRNAVLIVGNNDEKAI
jgi:hypothetical protein